MDESPKYEIVFNQTKCQAKAGENLRKALKRSGLNPHNGQAQWLNCKGLGTCGTCAVEVVSGSVPPLNARERWRLSFPPHQIEKGLRLACQLKVESPMQLRKHPGFWGEDISTEP